MKDLYGKNNQIIVNKGHYLKNTKSNKFYSHNEIIGNSIVKHKTNKYETLYYEYVIYKGVKYRGRHMFATLRNYCGKNNCNMLIKDYYVIVKDENNEIVICDIMLSNKNQDEKHPNLRIYKRDKIKIK